MVQADSGRKESNMYRQTPQRKGTDSRKHFGNSAPDRLLSFRKTLGQTGLSRSKTYELIAAGSHPRPIKIGRNNYFSEIEIQAWIDDRKAARYEGSIQ
jgi:predicted DNA-binding transcriptional regulator AlpA